MRCVIRSRSECEGSGEGRHSAGPYLLWRDLVTQITCARLTHSSGRSRWPMLKGSRSTGPHRTKVPFISSTVHRCVLSPVTVSVTTTLPRESGHGSDCACTDGMRPRMPRRLEDDQESNGPGVSHGNLRRM